MRNPKQFFVAEDGGVYNAFDIKMFDKNGYLEGHSGEEGYKLEDYDVVKWFDSWSAAADFSEKMNDEL